MMDLLPTNEFSGTSIHRWTQSAKECYIRGCVCKGCPIYELYFKHSNENCRMKNAVLESVRKLGITEDMKRNDIIED